MKNIYVLPTDKPSRVYKHLGRELIHTIRYFEQKGLLCINQHIYITSDEFIEEGDFGLNLSTKNIVQYDGIKGLDSYYKKIILTTDPELIKDGVQAIDDEFLEWFVKNPSCESVPIIPPLFGHPYIIWVEGLSFKKEPKQIKCYCGHTITCDCGPLETKQETLEEFISNSNTPDGLDQFSYDKGLEAGAKWQQERSYSEEEVLKILQYYDSYKETFIFQYIDKEDMETPEEWFEQFKKKN